MNPRDITKVISREIDSFEYVEPKDASVGKPFSNDKMQTYLSRLNNSLVTPYEQEFFLRDTYDQMTLPVPSIVTYWVVAKNDNYLLFYDHNNHEFGLGTEGVSREFPSTIGVRGDLVGVFVAI